MEGLCRVPCRHKNHFGDRTLDGEPSRLPYHSRRRRKKSRPLFIKLNLISRPSKSLEWNISTSSSTAWRRPQYADPTLSAMMSRETRADTVKLLPNSVSEYLKWIEAKTALAFGITYLKCVSSRSYSWRLSIYLSRVSLFGSRPNNPLVALEAITPQSMHDLLFNCDIAFANRSSCPGILTRDPKTELTEFQSSNGSYEIMAKEAIYFEHQIPVNASKIARLWQLMADPGTEPAPFLVRLKKWMVEVSGFQPLTKSQIAQLEKTVKIGSVGYISDADYTALILDHYLPLADPHDVLIHLPSMADPDFLEVLQIHADQVHTLAVGLMGVNERFILTDEPDHSAEPTPAHAKPHDLDVPQRPGCAIIPSRTGPISRRRRRRPHLFLQGNFGFNSINRFVRGDKDRESLERPLLSQAVALQRPDLV